MQPLPQDAETAIEEYRLSVLELERSEADYNAGRIAGYDDSRVVRAHHALLRLINPEAR